MRRSLSKWRFYNLKMTHAEHLILQTETERIIEEHTNLVCEVKQYHSERLVEKHEYK